MGEFLKCECSHCGQPIEYPSEGTGQLVPCPTCEKPVTLDDSQRKKEWDEWVTLNERLKERRTQSGISSSQAVKPTDRPSAKNEWDEWIALNKRLNERQIQSGIMPSEESVIPQNFSSKIPEEFKQPKQHFEMYCPTCGEQIEIQIAAVGKKIACPHCQSEIIPVFFTKIRPKKIRSRFANLTEETIRTKTSASNTPVHLAAKNGKVDLIPSHLLKIEMFMEKNKDGNTPLHIAAANGTLNQVPRQFLTKETLTVSNGAWITGSGYQARGNTVLHTAAISGHFDQIPKEFMTIEFLKIEATGYRNTVLQYLLMSNSLDVIPGIYTNSVLLDYNNSQGWSLRRAIAVKKESEASIARVRSEPATEKQIEKLKWFGVVVKSGIAKGEASDALDKCVKDFPEREQAYYSRPATEEQMAKLRSHYGKNLKDVDGPFTYGKVKDLISEFEMNKRCQDRVTDLEKTDYEFTLLRFLRWRVEHYRHLTYSRVKKAARTLDKINPGWTKSGDCEDLLLQKVTELFPEFATKENWQ